MSTKEDFKRFKAECERLQRLWQINDWDVRVKHENPRNKEALASCQAGSVKRVAVVRLNPKESDKEMPPEESARHEMVHVLLGEMSCIAGSRFITSDEVEAAEEALVQRLIRLLPR